MACTRFRIQFSSSVSSSSSYFFFIIMNRSIIPLIQLAIFGIGTPSRHNVTAYQLTRPRQRLPAIFPARCNALFIDDRRNLCIGKIVFVYHRGTLRSRRRERSAVHLNQSLEKTSSIEMSVRHTASRTLSNLISIP